MEDSNPIVHSVVSAPDKKWWEKLSLPVSRKTITTLTLLIVIAAIPMTVFLSQQNQDNRQRASVAEVVAQTIPATRVVQGQAYYAPFYEVPGTYKLRGSAGCAPGNDGCNGTLQVDIYNKTTTPPSYSTKYDVGTSFTLTSDQKALVVLRSSALTAEFTDAALINVDSNRPQGYIVYPESPSQVCTASAPAIVRGWACDPDRPSASISVDMHIDGTYLSGATVTANEDIFDGAALQAQCGHPGVKVNHGFSYTIPNFLRNTREHTIRAYGNNINTDGTLNPGPSYVNNVKLGEISNGITITANSNLKFACPIPATKIDGGWTAFSPKTSCPTTCGNPPQTLTRTCTNPPPSGGGNACTGSAELECGGTQRCETKVDGGWSAYSPAAACQTSCGFVGSTLQRTCTNPPPSGGGNACTGSNVLVCPPTAACVANTNGGWSAWSPTVACPTAPGSAASTLTRTCTSPAPSGTGTACTADGSLATLACSAIAANTNGGWSAWSACSATACGTAGTQTRTCTNPAKSGTGADCAGLASQACSAAACGTTVFGVIAKLGAIGGTGENRSPSNTTRQVIVQVFDSTDQLVLASTAQPITYSSTNGKFAGAISMGQALAAGNYTVKLKLDPYLVRKIPGIVPVTSSTTSTPLALTEPTPLVVGDINLDNKLYIDDYNILRDCVDTNSLLMSNPLSVFNSAICRAHPEKARADLDDNGTVDQVDYNVLIRSFSTRQGD